MSSYNTQQLSDMMDALTARVNALDGANLAPSVKGSVPQIIGQINSIQTDLGQLAANFENQLSQINTCLQNIQNQINVLSGVPTTQ